MHGVLHSLAEIANSAGITDVVICPGSRSAPLVLAFVRHGAFKSHVFSDERSAAFIALGMAQRTARPVVLISTSGSAAYNFAPAIAEAFFQQIPLLILTADRPREWIDQLDGQTIRQTNIFSGHVKRAWELNADYTHADSAWFAQRTFSEAIYTAEDAAPGPVHINFPFREPLYPISGSPIPEVPHRFIKSQAPVMTPSPQEMDELRYRLKAFDRILVVAGQGVHNNPLRQAVVQFTEHHQAVLVGDVLSNFHTAVQTVRHADGFLGALDSDRQTTLAPDLLITFGLSVISKNLKQFLRRHRPTEHWHLQPIGMAPDTFQSLTRIVRTDPVWFFTHASAQHTESKNTAYRAHWLALESGTATAVKRFFDATPSPSEFGAVHELLAHLPENSTLHLANSMPVRYANFIGLRHHQDVRVHANRGTSGIDGCTSTALGHALADQHTQVLLTGDVAFFYDSNAFWHDEPFPNFRIILLNNHGGGIFGLIDGPGNLPELPAYFITNQARNARALCAEFGIRYERYSTPGQWSGFFAGDGPALMEIESTTEQNKIIFHSFKQYLTSAV